MANYAWTTNDFTLNRQDTNIYAQCNYCSIRIPATLPEYSDQLGDAFFDPNHGCTNEPMKVPDIILPEVPVGADDQSDTV